MARQIFINLPVKDLKKSIEFFTKLGFTFNSQFTDERATCMIVEDNIFIMLIVEEYFKTFTKKEISDASKTTEVIVTLSSDSRENVDDFINKALKAGASSPNTTTDGSWMYGRSLQDLDGHLWEIIYMDMNAIPEKMTTEENK